MDRPPPRSFLGALLLSLLLVTACDTGTPASELDGQDAVTASFSPSVTGGVQVTSDRPPPYDEQLASLAERVPGFAGIYVDGDRLVLPMAAGPEASLLGGPEFTATVLSAVVGREAPAVDQIQAMLRERVARVETVEYGYKDLVLVKQKVGPAAKETSLVGYGIDHRLNRVVVDLVSLRDTTAILSALGASVPHGAIAFRQTEEGVRDVNLSSSVDPTVSGIKISPGCTMGFNVDAYVGGTASRWYRGFYTNDHCTSSLGTNLNDPTWTGVTGDVFRQPDGGRRIGAEYYNSETKAASVCGGTTPCFDGDVALAFYDADDQFRRGTIARPSATNDPSAWNGTDIYKVIGLDSYPVQGTAVRKVGYKTGETRGIITNTCFTYRDAAGAVACSFVVDGGSAAAPIRAGGDSGSPWFRVTSGENVVAVGLHFAGAGPTRAYANSMEDLLYDQGMPDYFYDITYDPTPR